MPFFAARFPICFWFFALISLAISIGGSGSGVQGQSSLSNYRNNFDRDRNGGDGDGDGFYTTQKYHDSIICMDIDPQRSLDMNQIMGTWYGNEIIIHTQDVPGVFHYDSCVVILISDITDQMQDYHFNTDYRRTIQSAHQQHDQYRPNYQHQQQQPHHHQQQQQHQQHQQHQPQPQYNQNGQHQYNGGGSGGQELEFPRQQQTRFLRLVWKERDDTLEYVFNYTTDSPGRWSNVGEQRGSLVALNHYTQFSGTVQVAKAVNDHLVLTFCGNDVKSSIYTIVLSRNPEGLSSKELFSIRTLLSNRHLSIDTIRKICSSAASAGVTATIKIIVLFASALLFRKHY